MTVSTGAVFFFKVKTYGVQESRVQSERITSSERILILATSWDGRRRRRLRKR